MTAWRRTIGRRPTLILAEREDRHRQVYARWWCSQAQAWRRRASGLYLRSDSSGEIDAAREADVVEYGYRLHAQLMRGEGPGAPAPVTVRQVLDRYLTSEVEGLGRRYRQDLARAARVVEEVLGASTPWATVTAGSVAQVWRTLARRSPAGRGRRWAMRVAELVWRTGAWAELEGLVGHGGGPRPPHNWRHACNRDWTRLTGVERESPARPRYSLEELRALWSALDRSDARLRVGLECGISLRLGQVAKARRRDLDLTLGTGVHGLGTLRIRGRGRKGGALVSLDARARRVVEEALLDGPLSILEAARRDGQIADFPLLPGGPLVEGRVPLGASSTRPMSASTLRRLYGSWEREAGLQPVAGRGWHALRRTAADLAADLHDDPAVLDCVGGWSPGSRVRTQIYRARSDTRVITEAERVRARLRASLRGPEDHHAGLRKMDGSAGRLSHNRDRP